MLTILIKGDVHPIRVPNQMHEHTSETENTFILSKEKKNRNCEFYIAKGNQPPIAYPSSFNGQK